MAENTKTKGQETNYLEFMRSQKFYNEKRIPGYNHLLGMLEGKPTPTKYELKQPTIGNLK